MKIEDVIKFLEKNSAISLSGLDKEAGFSSSTMCRVMSGDRNLSEKSLQKLEPVLRKYGYTNPNGAKIISIVNNKGGVAKTTTCANLGRALHLKGFKVLMLDMDPQGNLSQTFEIHHPEQELYQTLSFSINAPIQDCIMEIFEGLDICPSTISLGQASLDLQNNQLAGYKRMRNVLENIKNEYDYILIDCPPTLDILTSTSIFASNSVLIPVEPESHAINGLKNVFSLINQMKEFNQVLSIEGILFTSVQKNTVLHKNYMSEIIETLSDTIPIFKTVIRQNISISEATAQNVSVIDYDIQSNGAVDYLNLSNEIINGEKEI